MRRWTGALMTTAVVAGLVAGPAGAKVTFSGIGDVRLNMSEAAVREALGTPSSSRSLRHGDREAVTLLYRRRKIEVVLDRDADRVMGVKTTSRAQKTSSGLGVGSSLRSVRDKLRGEKCGTALRVLVCSVERGESVIDFDLRRGKVVRVSVSRNSAG
jgi:hypothetical protein